MHFKNADIWGTMRITFYDWILIINFLVSLTVFFQKPAPPYLKSFPFYFFCILILGMIMEYMGTHGQYNTALGNIYGILEFCYFFYIMREVIVNAKVKRIILAIIVLFALFAFSNIIFIQKKVGFNPVNFTAGCLIIISFCIYYFVELFQKSEIQSLARLPAFWIVSAFLFYTALSFPIFAMESFMDELTKANWKTYHILHDHITVINNITVLLTGVLYSIGFLCRTRIFKSTL